MNARKEPGGRLAAVVPLRPDADQESVIVAPPAQGVPVDPRDEPHQTHRQRRAVLPTWLRSRRDVLVAVRWTVNQAAYLVAFHVIRLPKYLGKIALYAPLGAARAVGRLLRWATAEDGNLALRQAAATRDDPAMWLRLDMQRQRQSRWRWTLLAVTTLVAVVAIAVGWTAVPRAVIWLAGVLAVVLSARAGRPGDKPITDRVTEAHPYRKLTAELELLSIPVDQDL